MLHWQIGLSRDPVETAKRRVRGVALRPLAPQATETKIINRSFM